MGTNFEFLSGGGEMGAQIRAYPWHDTSLGPPENWPQSLRTALRILLTTQHPIYIFWGPDLICFYNDAYARSLGAEQHPSMLGQPGRLQWPLIWDAIGPQIEQVMSGRGATWHENQRLVIERNGQLEDIWWTYSYGPIDEATAPNNVGGVLVICTETTEAVLADQRKNEFLAMLAHELRNPLAPIRNATMVLERQLEKDASARPLIEMVQRQVTHLSRLVDDLMDVSRISQGRIELRREDVLLSEALDQALETIAPMAREKDQRIARVSDHEALWVNADRSRLVQIFSNVLANSVKYTHQGGHVAVDVSATREVVSVKVSDDGAGISAEQLPRLFGMFVQAEQSLDRVEGGLGIGLSVVQKLVEMHDGEVFASSPGLGKGATFEICLPRGRPPATTDQEERAGDVNQRRVLVVDDNEDAAEALAQLLRLDGHTVETAYESHVALDRFDEFCPDIVLLDIGLPEMDGFEVARRLRSRMGDHPAKLAALTGYGQREDRERAIASGFDEHLVKPVSYEELRQVLND